MPRVWPPPKNNPEEEAKQPSVADRAAAFSSGNVSNSSQRRGSRGLGVKDRAAVMSRSAGTTEGSLANFMGRQLGVRHQGKSTGMVKSRVDTSQDASSRAFHANRSANKGMAAAFAQMVVSNKRNGAMPKPSELARQRANSAEQKSSQPEPQPEQSRRRSKTQHAAPAQDAIALIIGNDSKSSTPNKSASPAPAPKASKPPRPSGVPPGAAPVILPQAKRTVDVQSVLGSIAGTNNGAATEAKADSEVKDTMAEDVGGEEKTRISVAWLKTFASLKYKPDKFLQAQIDKLEAEGIEYAHELEVVSRDSLQAARIAALVLDSIKPLFA